MKIISEGKNRLYQIDDKTVSEEEVNALKPEEIKSIDIHKKSPLLEEETPDNNEDMLAVDTQKPLRTELRSSNKKTLIVLDGEIIEADSLAKKDPNSIERIDILKDEKAIEKYGEQAKDGVVIITSK